VEPEKQQLLGNGPETFFLRNGRETNKEQHPFARQEIFNKQISASVAG
jgi:hypothetical protein